MTAGIVIGVDFGHTHLRVAVGNLAHQVLAEEAEPLDVDASAAEGFDRAEQLVNRLIEATGIGRDKVIGVGLGVPGPIDVSSGTLGSTSILPGWSGINPAEELSGRLGVPVHVDNDANLGALGELVWGSGRGVKDLAYIKVASGVGGRPRHRRAGLPGPRRHRRMRSVTSRWTSRARSAAAATAAAWRPSRPPGTCFRCSSPATAPI